MAGVGMGISKTNSTSKEALLTSSSGPGTIVGSASTTSPRLHQKLERATRPSQNHQHTASMESANKMGASQAKRKGRKNSQNQVMQVHPGDPASSGITQIQLKLFSDGKY